MVPPALVGSCEVRGASGYSIARVGKLVVISVEII